jgi:hypothetical protein
MGTFRSFEIALPGGNVVAQHDQLTSKQLFAADLGIELESADDSCIKKAASCMPPGLK